MIIEKSIMDFNAELASPSAVPGGGGVSALVASLGTGLGIMVGCLTVGKKKYADTEVAVRALIKEADGLNRRFLKLVDEDAAAFEPLSKVYSMPKDDTGRDALMEECLYRAASVPYEIVRLSCEAIRLMRGFAEYGSVLALSDAGCGAAFCRAALEGAALNVLANTRLMKNRERAEEMNSFVDECLEEFPAAADEIYDSVRRRLK